MKGEQLLKYESVQNWINSLDQTATNRGKDGLTKNAKAVRLGRMWEYTEEGLLNPDELLKEAQKNIDNAGQRLKDYFEKKKAKTSHNTASTAVCFIRGFYTHNDLVFPKKWGVPRRETTQVSKTDEKTSMYQYNEETDEIEFQNGNMIQFIQNLNLQNQTIALCLLSSGADATDLFKLKVGFVKDDKGNISKRKRFFWQGNRAKTGKPFKTFFSAEATEFLKRFVEQEKANASDDELLFTTTTGKPMDAHLLSINFRNATVKMGYARNTGKVSPFRPKRFRHLFKTACSIAEIDKGFTKTFMGHSMDTNDGYLESSSGILEKVYTKVEPKLIVFSSGKAQADRERAELRDKLLVVEEGTKGVADKTEQLEAKIQELTEKLEVAVNYIWSLQTEIEDRDKAEAEEDFKQLVAEVNKEHPVAKKPKKVK